MTTAKKPDTNTNLDLWNRLEPTDPKFTKSFKGAGGFSGTATNGTYILKRLTEEFGACGRGWRFVLDSEQIIEGHKLKSGDTARLHKILGHLEYGEKVNGAFPHQTSPQFGQTMLVGENKYGTFTDEEAPKKSITDCISKCAVMLGIAADVHLGLFDDNKYVNQRKQEEAVEAAQSAPVPAPQQDKAPPAAAPAASGTLTAADLRTAFYAVKSLVETAKTSEEIDAVMRENREFLRDLENQSPKNFEGMRVIVEDRRKAVSKPSADPAMNDDIPAFEDVGR